MVVLMQIEVWRWLGPLVYGGVQQLRSSYQLKLSIIDMGKCVTGGGRELRASRPYSDMARTCPDAFDRDGHGTNVTLDAAIKFHNGKSLPSPRWASKEGLE